MDLFFLLLLLALMAFALGSGYPVAFALPGSSIITILLAAGAGYLFEGSTDAYFSQGGPSQWLSAGVTNLRGVYWEPERDTLIAIPLFIFMGIMLQRSKIAEDLLITMARLFGPIPGGLGISVVFVGALLAATTGIVGATVVAMGLISLPAMLRNNYSQGLATGTIAASGTLGQIIPPSIVLIILADQLTSAADQAGTARKALYSDSTGELSMPTLFDVTSTSAGEMFLGAFIPGMVLVGLYMLYILVIAVLRPKLAPPVHYDGAYDREFLIRVFVTLVPPLLLIFLVLGSIIGGIATVNQAGAIGAAGAMIMAGYRLHEGEPRAYVPAILAILALVALTFVVGNFDTNIRNIQSSSDQLGVTLAILAAGLLIFALAWSGWRVFKDGTLQGVMLETAKTTSLVFIILLGAAMLTAAFRAFGGEHLVKEFLEGLPGGFWTKFVIVMAVIFVLGFFLDFIEIAVVVVPIVAPILLADPGANITAVWLGVMIGLNIQTSFLTPPFGFALFYLRGVAPAIVTTLNMYKGVIPFILLQLSALAIVGATPQMVNYLPNRVALLSETAPPPRNPRLSYCVDQFVTEQVAANGERIRSMAEQVRALDLTVLPEDFAEDLVDGLDAVPVALDSLAEGLTAREAVLAASDAYRPIHDEVRALERDIRADETRIEELALRASRMRSEEQQDDKARLEGVVAELTAERDMLAARIPAEWEETYAAFRELTDAEDDALNIHRRAASDAYEPVGEIVAILQANAAFAELEGEIEAVRARFPNGDETAEYIAELEALAARFDLVAGAGDIASDISGAARELGSRSPEPEEAAADLDSAIEAFAEQAAWRDTAEAALLGPLADFEALIRPSLGLRNQEDFTREQALFVASCTSVHRDISLNF